MSVSLTCNSISLLGTVLIKSPSCGSNPKRNALKVARCQAAASGGTASSAKPEKKKPTIPKGTVVRVDKEKYLSSVEALAVDHPPNFSGLDYIYEARGEILDVRFFPTGEYAMVAWAGIPTAPAWLPISMLIVEKALAYKRT